MIAKTVCAHRGIAFVLALFLALGIFYSVTTPLFEAPDEQWHFAFVQYVATGRGLPVQTIDRPTHLARQEGSQPPLYYLLAAAATVWIDTSDYPGIIWENPHYGYDVPGIINDNKNLFIHTSLESFPYHGAVLAIHIARLLSVVMGALAVLFTYLLALEIFPNRKYLAASAAALVAFVPQFLFISSAVSNDSTIVAMSALSLWLMVRVICHFEPRRDKATLAPAASAGVSKSETEIASSQQPFLAMTNRHLQLRDAVVLGAATGLAALAKVSGAGLVVLAALVLAYALRTDWKRLVQYLVAFGLVFAVIAGWWYLRNLMLYGELTGTAMMIRIFGARTTPLTTMQLLTQLSEVWETFWVGFGWGNIRAAPAIYTLLEIVAATSGIGLLVGLVRRRAHLRATLVKSLPLFVLALWTLAAFAELVNWMQITQAPHGRLFFPALPTLAPLVALGLTQWAPKHARPLVARGLAIMLFAFAAIAPFAILEPAYAFPPFLSDAPAISNRVDISYGNKMKLLGYNIAPNRVRPGEWATLTLYWQSLAPMDQDYSIGIHVVDSGGRVISARDSYPGHGLLPTRLWRAGQILRDAYWLPIAGDATAPSIAWIQVSLYSRQDRRELPAFDPGGDEVPTPIVGRLKVSGVNLVAPQPQNATQYSFGKQIDLIGYDLNLAKAQSVQPSQGLDLTLYWKRAAPIDADYTVFVHVLDANGKIVAQRDIQPAEGDNPTSFWDEGEIVTDQYAFALPRGAYRVELGLYRADNGQRLPVTDAQGNALGDHVTLSAEVGP